MLPDITPYPNVSNKEGNQTYGHYGHKFHVDCHLEFPWTLVIVKPKK